MEVCTYISNFYFTGSCCIETYILPPAGFKMLALADVGFQPTHGFGQIVDGIGVGKAQEPFGLAAEVDTGGDADMGFFQQVEGQFHGAAAQMAGIDQHVERAHGFHGDVEAQTLQFAQQKTAAFVVVQSTLSGESSSC